MENSSNNKLIKKEETPIERTKSNQIILEEDEYTNALEKIIERDFYPDLKTPTKFQEEISNATPTLDSHFATPVAKPFATPSSITEEQQIKNNKLKSQVSKDSEKLSLNSFLHKYTSEDKASFDVIQEKTKELHKQKYPWLYKDEAVENEKVQNMLEFKDGKEDKQNTLMWTYKNKNSLMYIPEGAELTMEEKLKQKTKKQMTLYKNTRLEKSPFNESVQNMIGQIAGVQARMKEGKVGVDGKEFCPKDSPRVNGFGFVPSTPLLTPGASPLMTWGEIESTPAPLEREMTPGPQFRIPEVPLRERLAISLASDNRKKNAQKKEMAMEEMKSKLTSPRTPLLESLSPAAQRLASARLGLKRGRDSALMASYSPSPQRSTPAVATPSPHHTPSSLTDGLLQLPKKRKQAQDFF